MILVPKTYMAQAYSLMRVNETTTGQTKNLTNLCIHDASLTTNNGRGLMDQQTASRRVSGRLARDLSKAVTKVVSKGFTLIEIMVVIVIIGVLAALVAPRVLSRTDEARATAARQDVSSVMAALKLYRLDNQRYPSTEQGLQALVSKATIDPIPNNWKQYLDKLPVDPWGKPYQFLNPGLRGEIDVFSFGADGQSGGTGFDADVGSWDK